MIRDCRCCGVIASGLLALLLLVGWFGGRPLGIIIGDAVEDGVLTS
jgi:hypothetical protein